MRKAGVLLLTFSLLFVICTSPIGAQSSLLVINKNGEIIWDVLSSNDSLALGVAKPKNISVTDVATGSSEENILIQRDGEKISMLVGETKELDVTGWEHNLIEIEERGDTKSIAISLKDNKFNLSQEGVVAQTTFPIKIDPKLNKVTLTTETGDKFLAVLPVEAAQVALRARIVTKLSSSPIEIIEDGKDLTYKIAGIKEINLFDLYKLGVNVAAKVSASTGEVLTTEEPSWLKVLRPIVG